MNRMLLPINKEKLEGCIRYFGDKAIYCRDIMLPSQYGNYKKHRI